MLPRIFIGGTGRSGTTILYKLLGNHKTIHSLEKEMRFLIDPDGLINLIDALTNKYSPVQAAEALFRFERLMRIDLNTPKRAPFLTYEIGNWLGSDYYWDRLDRFCSEIVELEHHRPPESQPKPYRERRINASIRFLYKFSSRLLKEVEISHRTTFNWPRSTMKLVKYFPERKKLVALAAQFVDDLFLYGAHQRGKETWCEKTPQNIFYLDFLWELFPQSCVIHIKRDPRGVVHSVMKQPWGPDNLQDACSFLQIVYNRWFDVESRIDLRNCRYFELKLEDLAASPADVLEKVAIFCGLKNCFQNPINIEEDKVNYWKRTMSREEIQSVNRLLGPYIERMGYEV